jgi:hypothetical protein
VWASPSVLSGDDIFTLPLGGDRTMELKTCGGAKVGQPPLLKLFTFDKKRELEKYCRDVVIKSTDFANFILTCEVAGLPFRHQIYYRDHVAGGPPFDFLWRHQHRGCSILRLFFAKGGVPPTSISRFFPRFVSPTLAKNARMGHPH